MSRVEKVIIVKRLGIDVPFAEERDLWWHEEMAKEDIRLHSEPAIMDAEDPLFILYTSGSQANQRGSSIPQEAISSLFIRP